MLYNVFLLIVLLIAGCLLTGFTWTGAVLGFVTGIMIIYDEKRKEIIIRKDERIKALSICINVLVETKNYEKRIKIAEEHDVRKIESLY
jgi:energy-converting hydrogenase Eha subunit G